MWRKILLIALIVLVAGGGLFALVWPEIEKEMMTGPVVDALAAVRSGDMERLRGAFTEDAVVMHGELRLPIDTALKLAEPELHGYRSGGARFGGFSNLRRVSRDEVETDCTIWISMEGGGDLPYRRVVAKRTGHLRLQRQGWLEWKIAQFSSEEAEFGDAVTDDE